MALVLEDGTGIPGANSYASVEECDAYHEKHLYADPWFSAGTSSQQTGQGNAPESGDVALTQGQDTPVEIEFETQRADDQYAISVWFENVVDALPDVIQWVVTAKTRDGMTINIGPSPSTTNTILHWRVDGNATTAPTILTRKSQALMMATRVLDSNIEWFGFRNDDAQALDWPRYGIERRDSSQAGLFFPVALARGTGMGIYWPPDEIPKPLKYATCELARELLKADRTVEPSQKGVTQFSLGQGAISASFDKTDRPQAMTEQVLYMLAGFGQSRASRSTIRLERS